MLRMVLQIRPKLCQSLRCRKRPCYKHQSSCIILANGTSCVVKQSYISIICPRHSSRELRLAMFSIESSEVIRRPSQRCTMRRRAMNQAVARLMDRLLEHHHRDLPLRRRLPIKRKRELPSGRSSSMAKSHRFGGFQSTSHKIH